METDRGGGGRLPRGERYTRVAIALHWAIALCIAFNLGVGFFMEGWPMPLRGIVVMLHASAGLTVLVLTVIRVCWRLLHEPPAYPAGMRRWERHLAHFVHFFLYCAMVLMPLTGWAILSSHPPYASPGYKADQARKTAKAPPRPAGAPKPKPQIGITVFGVITVPAIAPIARIGEQPEGLAAQDTLHEELVDYHAVGAYLLLGLLALHIAGALKHQLIDGHDELPRMGVGRVRRTRG